MTSALSGMQASSRPCGRDACAPTPAEALAAARRLVIKIGSALLAAESGEIRRPWLAALADDVARCRSRGQEVILVSSGAIAVGRRQLNLAGRRLRLEEKQAAAATGQIRLAHAYQEALARHRITVAQILLTPDDTEERRRHLNARATFAQLLALGAVPVVNENDTIATAEIRFGDNDRLAARVAQMTSADMLVVDDGAARALRGGKSLLPAGVVGVEGAFERGDCVIVRTRAGGEAGRGLSAYSSADIRRIAGHKSGEIAAILGYRGRDEIIHRDDLVVT